MMSTSTSTALTTTTSPRPAKSTPSTPTIQTAQKPVSTPSPGNWRHPRYDEIVRRRRRNVFDDTNIRRILYNTLTLFGLTYAITQTPISSLLPSPTWLTPFIQPSLTILVLVLLYNIATAILPLYRNKDEMTDIPLTPTQRALLGLNPNASQPQSPAGTTYITPPRYPRSPLPTSSSNPNSPTSIYDSAGASAGHTPWATSRPRGVSPRYDTPSSSPLYQKTRAVEQMRRRNSTQGTPSPLGRRGDGALEASTLGNSTFGTSMIGAGTPSPLTGKGASVGLNSKWLYERGRSTSSSSLARSGY